VKVLSASARGVCAVDVALIVTHVVRTI